MSNIEHSQRAHSKIGASSSKRWFTCPGSVPLSEGIENKSSVHAEEGTAAHEMSEYCLENDMDAMFARNLEFNGFNGSEEMCEAVQVYLDEINRRITEDSEVQIEQRFTLDWIDEDAFGTNDCTIYDPTTGKLTIIDYKHGKGMGVEAVGNTQLLYYALGAARDLPIINSVELVIVQPRFHHSDGPVRSWIVPLETLDSYESEVAERIKEVREAEASSDPYKYTEAGSHCHFCPAAGFCETLKAKAYITAAQDFDTVEEVSLPEPSKLTSKQLTTVLTNANLIGKWVESVKKFAKSEADRGIEVVGYKLVKAKANRKWKDEVKVVDEFEAMFGDDIYSPRKIKTPAQMEKIMGKESVKEFTETPETGTSLVPNKDKRTAVAAKAIEDFDDI